MVNGKRLELKNASRASRCSTRRNRADLTGNKRSATAARAAPAR